MAEVTAMRSNALPYPVYGAPWTLVFPLLDADGDPISPSSPDSEVSKNGDTFADCTNEMTEIATSSGVCYLTLTGTEMTADVVGVLGKSTGAKTTVLTMYPRKLPTLHSGTAAAGAAGTITLDAAASAFDDFYNGCIVIGTLDSAVEVRMITDYVGSTKVATVVPDWVTTPDSDDTFVIRLPEGRHVQQTNAADVVFAGNFVVREDTASQEITLGPFINPITGAAATGLTIANTDVKITKEGAATLVSKNSGGGTHIADGYYTFTFDATDFDTAGKAFAKIVVPGAKPVQASFDVLPTASAEAIYDGDALAVNLTAILGTALTEGAAGRIAAAFQGMFNVTSPVFTAQSVNQTGDAYSRLGAPAGASTAADIAAISTKTANLPPDPADQSLIIAGTDAIYNRLGAPAGASVSADIAAVAASLAAQLITALTEPAVRTNGATGSVSQLLYEMLALLSEKAASGTTLTTKKVDHSTTHATYTLSDATNPTSITRAS